MWYLNHFLLSPFDDRYLKLPFEWIEFSYTRFFSQPNPSKCRDNLYELKIKKQSEEKEKERKAAEKQEIEDNMKKHSGHNSATIEEIMSAMNEAKK